MEEVMEKCLFKGSANDPRRSESFETRNKDLTTKESSLFPLLLKFALLTIMYVTGGAVSLG